MCHAVEGQQVVFTHRIHGDVTHQHHFVMANVKDFVQVVGGVFA